jgi:hypothetical protein
MSYELFRRLLPDFNRALFEVLKKIRLPENQEPLSFVSEIKLSQRRN